MAARASRTRSVVGALALAALLTSCATGVEVDDETVGATPSASPEPTSESTTFTTQNGTASFALPSGWTVDDSSSLTQNFGGQPQWANVVQVLDAGGATRASYADGFGNDISGGGEEGVVQSLPMAGATTAVAWWSHDPESGAWRADAAVVTDSEDPFHVVPSAVEGRFASFVADLSAAPECASVVDEATAVACLEAPSVTETLEVLASLELTDVPWDAMPEGVDPVADVPWTRFESADGAIAFDHPASWTVAATVDGRGFILSTLDGYETLHFSLLPPDWGGSDLAATACTDPSVGQQMTVLESEPATPFVGDLASSAGELEIVTADYGDGFIGVAILRAEDAAVGCLSQTIPVGDAAVWAATDWGTDAPMQIYAKYPGGAGFVGSFDQLVMVQVLRTLEIRQLGV